ncbi:MAG: ABC transporter permease [Chloroflexi bacterium]|nr:ABC transporter permease [Chloroflexota bacterium]
MLPRWLRFVVRRFGLMFLTLFLVTIAIFGIVAAMPADVAQYMLGQHATPEALAVLRERLGLDQPAHIRYVRWLTGTLRGDLGYSPYLGGDIAAVLMTRIRNSLFMGAVGFVICVPLAIVLGVLAGVFAGRLVDRVISITSLAALSLPEFVSAVALTLILSTWLGWLPPSSLMEADAAPWEHLDRLILPALTATLAILAYIARMTRGSVIDVMNQPYVRTARLKGLPRRVVIFKHALRNALLPTITVVFNSMGWLMGGLVIVETFFAYPGVARLLLAGVERNDLPLLQATTLLIAVITLLANFMADVAYALLNPRIRLS